MRESGESHTHQQEYHLKTEAGSRKDNTMEEDTGGTTKIKTPKKTWSKKYGNSLKILLPFRLNSNQKQVFPSGKSGCFTFASLGWLSSVMLNAYSKGMGKTANWKLSAEDSSEVNYERLDTHWRKEVLHNGAEASFPKAVWTFVRTRTLVAILLVFLYSAFNIITPSLLFKKLVEFMENENRDAFDGLIIVGAIAISQLLRILLSSASWIFSAHTAMRIQGAIKLFLFRKALRLRLRGDKFMSQVIQNITVETDRVFEATARGISSFATIVVMVFIMFYSVMTIGWWSLLGVAVLLFAIPITTLLAKQSAVIRRYAIPYTEERIHIMNEVLTNIRLIKMYGWETPFVSKVTDVRNEERKHLQRSAFIHSISQTTSPVICVIAAVVVFLGHTLSGNTMTASEAFSVFTLFAAARTALATTTNNAKQISDAIMGCRQMKKLIFATEVSDKGRFELPESSEEAIVLQSTTFSWKEVEDSCADPNEKHGVDNLAFPGTCSLSSNESFASASSTPMLKNFDLKIRKGNLVGICGSVGSGKSSLLSAIYGDMIIVTGQVGLNGTLSYVPQQAWVHCGTLRENILFGRPLEKNRYDTIVEACCLVSDINILPNGDQTEIGERGTNLSGGQRQRINLARALYSDSDVYLFDDPLSAVDTRVAKYIFTNAIRGFLKGKTVVMVTHGMHFLERCDQVILLENNCIEEQGTHKELLNHGGRYTQMFNFVQANDDVEAEGETKSDKQETVINHDDNANEMGRLVIPEEKQQGQVSFHTYAAYIKACGGYCVALMVFGVFCLHTATILFNGIWLQRWLDDGDGSHGTPFQKQLIPTDPDEEYEFYLFDPNLPGNETRVPIPRKHSNIVENPLLWMYALVYCVSAVFLVLTGVLQSYCSTLISLIASSKLHNKMFQRVLHCPMSFFDTTPVGRILNRFSKDMDELDYTFPFQLGYVVQYSLAMIGQMVLVGVIFPWCSIALVIIMVLIMIMDIWFHAGIREMKRYESIARSGIVVQLTSAMQGLSIIRVFGKQDMFIKQFHTFVNEHQKCHMLFYATLLWFAFRVEVLCSLLVIITALLITYSPYITPAMAGLALSASFQVTQIVTGLIRNKSDLQARFTAVERINEYAKTLPQEQSVLSAKSPVPVPREWPPDGSITLKDVQLSYRPGLPLVLKGINCHIKGGEKIGVIGRTGAGKSSLIGTLLRLMEIDSGSITIDGIDISNIPLAQLRSVLAVIPQEPVLFQGTIRYNLDPFGEYTDEMLWNALEQSYLKEKISLESMQLEAVVHADGNNFSVGEKQLICLARTILRKNKILLLDEATAFVDVETDFKIQKTVLETFAECTILTIAHRLNTIWDSDRILVLDSGKVAEFDSPEVLMNDESSFFRAMMLAMGVTQLSPNRAIQMGESSSSSCL